MYWREWHEANVLFFRFLSEESEYDFPGWPWHFWIQSPNAYLGKFLKDTVVVPTVQNGQTKWNDILIQTDARLKYGFRISLTKYREIINYCSSLGLTLSPTDLHRPFTVLSEFIFVTLTSPPNIPYLWGTRFKGCLGEVTDLICEEQYQHRNRHIKYLFFCPD